MLKKDVAAAVLVDRTGDTGAYLHQYFTTTVENGKTPAPTIVGAKMGTELSGGPIAERWYWNQRQISPWIAGVTATVQSTFAIRPPSGGGTTAGIYFRFFRYIQELYKKKKKYLQKGRGIDEKRLEELIKQYQEYLLLTHTTIFWNSHKQKKDRHLAGGSPTAEQMWDGPAIDRFFTDMAANYSDDEWGKYKEAKIELKRLIGSSALQAVEDLTFIMRGKEVLGEPTKITYDPDNPANGLPFYRLMDKMKVPVTMRNATSGANEKNPNWHNGAVSIDEPFHMRRFEVDVPKEKPTLIPWITANAPGGTKATDLAFNGDPPLERPVSFTYPLVITSPRDFLQQLGLTPSYTPTQIKEIILTRFLMKIDAFTEESLKELDARGVLDTTSRDEVRGAIAIALSKNRELEEPNIEQLLAESRQRQLFNGQCFLIQQAASAAQYNRKRLNDNKRISTTLYPHTRMVTNSANTAATLNLLSRGNSQEKILKATTSDLAKLLPYVRIYKIVYDRHGKQLGEVEFKFPNFTNVEKTNIKMGVAIKNTVLQNNLYQEYGLKSFSWKFIGSDPFSYANDIESTMVLYFQDFEQLSIPRKSDLSVDPIYRLLDLLVPTSSDPAAPNKILKFEENKFLYDIRVDVGNGGAKSEEGFNPADSIRSLYLAMVDYDISFSQEGFFELTINYKSRLEQTLYNKETSILGKQLTTNVDIRRLEEELKESKKEEAAPQEVIATLEKEINEAKLNITKEAFSKIHSSMIRNGNVYSMRVPRGHLFPDHDASAPPSDWVKTTNVTEFPSTTSTTSGRFPSVELIQALTEIPSDPDKDIDVASFIPKKNPSKPGEYRVNFVYLVDLIDVASDIAFTSASSGTSPRARSTRKFLDDSVVVLGDFFMFDPLNLSQKKPMAVNFGDLAIHYELYTKFYYEKVIKYNVTSYPLMKFIKDLISYCVLNVMDRCFSNQGEVLRSSIKTSFMSFAKRDPFAGASFKMEPFKQCARERNTATTSVSVGQDPLSPTQFYKTGAPLRSIYLDLHPPDKPKPEISQNKKQSDCSHALIITSTAFDPQMLKIDPAQYWDKRGKDTKAGIYHLDVGSAKGIVKNVSFAKTDQQFLREQRMTTSSTLGILSNVFDVSIDLYGNTLFYPGQRIYINLGERFSSLKKPYVANSFANIMGLGGYHIITSVESEISQGKFETRIQARWETSGDGERR